MCARHLVVKLLVPKTCAKMKVRQKLILFKVFKSIIIPFGKNHVDVKINEQRKKEVALEEEERLRNRKNMLLCCCRYLSRQCLVFHGSKDEFDRNLNQCTFEQDGFQS